MGDDRATRDRLILQAIREAPVSSQDELRRRLARRGVHASQSTLSRDIRRLGLVKVPSPDGPPRYALPEPTPDEEGQRLERLLPDLLVGVTATGNLLVVKTLSGAAQPVAAALDHADWPEVLGTIAGDDTLLVVLRGHPEAPGVAERLRRLATPPGD